MWKSLKTRMDPKDPRGPASANWTAVLTAIVGLVGVAAVLGMRQGPDARVDAHPIDWDGHYWSELSAGEKDAYLGGFLAGAAAAQAYEALEEVASFDAEALSQRMEGLRGERALIFPYAPNLYHARLHDYLFYVNHREQPLYLSLAELNFQIRGARR